MSPTAPTDRNDDMQLFAIHRRNLCTSDELPEVDRRSQAELDRRTDRLRKVRSYVTGEEDGTVDTICVYEATSVDDIHAHAEAANLVVTDIQQITAIDVQRPDPDRLLV